MVGTVSAPTYLRTFSNILYTVSTGTRLLGVGTVGIRLFKIRCGRYRAGTYLPEQSLPTICMEGTRLVEMGTVGTVPAPTDLIKFFNIMSDRYGCRAV